MALSFLPVVACSNGLKTAGPSTTPVPRTGISAPVSSSGSYETVRIAPGIVVPNVPVEQLPLGRAGCSPPSPIGNTGETRGTTINGAQLFGLVFLQHLPIRVGDRDKVVWRMSGTGPLVATAISPSGAPTPLLFFDPHHGVTTYHRPGDEWGTGYGFTEPGCWHLHFARSDTQGDVWFNVVAA